MTGGPAGGQDVPQGQPVGRGAERAYAGLRQGSPSGTGSSLGTGELPGFRAVEQSLGGKQPLPCRVGRVQIWPALLVRCVALG